MPACPVLHNATASANNVASAALHNVTATWLKQYNTCNFQIMQQEGEYQVSGDVKDIFPDFVTVSTGSFLIDIPLVSV